MSLRLPKIGMVTCDYLPSEGGMGRHVATLVEGLRHQTYDVAVFDSSRRPLRYRLGRNVLFSLGIEGALKRWIQKERIDILHVHTGPGGVLLRSHSKNIPLIVTANHTYLQQSTLPGQGWKSVLIPWERSTYQAAKQIVCISEDTREILIREYRIPAENVRTIECGFPLSPWVTADMEWSGRDHRRVVFVGRRDRRKGFDLLMDAWPRVRVSVPDAQLSIVGVEGESRDGIIFHGRLPDGELQALIGSSVCLVCPSRLEGFGLAAAEAIAAGTPVVACDTAGLRQVVTNRKNGLLTNIDAASVADSLRLILSDHVLSASLHLGARATRARFGIEREIAAHEQLYSSLH